MRKFKRTFRVESTAVQGEGSFVVFKNLTWGEMRAMPDGLTVAEAAAMRVVEWNWTDEEGELLPLPSGAPEIIPELMSEEINFLVEASTRGIQEEEKN